MFKIAETVKSWITDADREKATSPQTQMAVALARSGKPTYEGTVPAAVVDRRRATNKRARRARALHRRAARR